MPLTMLVAQHYTEDDICSSAMLGKGCLYICVMSNSLFAWYPIVRKTSGNEAHVRLWSYIRLLHHVHICWNNDNVDKPFVKELQTIPLILKLYIWKISHYTSTFGQSCWLTFLRCKYHTMSIVSPLDDHEIMPQKVPISILSYNNLSYLSYFYIYPIYLIKLIIYFEKSKHSVRIRKIVYSSSSPILSLPILDLDLSMCLY